MIIKLLTCLVFLHLPFESLGQTDSLVRYSEIIQVPNADKGELFNRARSWFNDAFKDSKQVVQVSDKDAGEIAGKGVMIHEIPYSFLVSQYVGKVIVRFNCSIWLKDNRYRYEFSDFEAKDENNGFNYGYLTNSDEMPVQVAMGKKKGNKYWIDIKTTTDIEAKMLVQSLKVKMSKPSPALDNW